jgi:hypothetical protein
MTDDSLTPEAEMASATFDGETTPVERARVDASPEAASALAAFASIRAQLNDVAVPAGAREAALVAALGVFDETHPNASSALLANVVSLDKRRLRQQRWLTGAAAAAVIAVVAVGIISTSGSDSKSSTQNLSAGAESSQTKLPAAADIGAATADSAAAADSSGAGAGPQINAVTGPAVVTPWALAPNLATTAELAAFAASPSFGSAPAPSQPIPAGSDTSNDTAKSAATIAYAAQFNTPCLAGVTTAFAAVVFQGQQVLAIRDDVAKTLRVINPTTCAVVTTVNLP